MAHSGKKPEDLPKPVVEHGHPMDPNRGVLLSEDDEKSIDEEGRPIIGGKLWSQAHTGAYLCVAVVYGDQDISTGKTMIGYRKLGGKATDERYVHIFCSIGKPKINQRYAGACLEVPSDLGDDEIKQKYVTEWVLSTAAEALVMAGATTMVNDPVLQNQTAQEVLMKANLSLNALGL
jgi:hypothetical protein